MSRQLIWTCLSALAVTASLPPFDYFWIAWVGLTPLLLILREAQPKRRLLIGLSWGLVHFVSMLYWVVWVLGYYGGMGPLVSIGPMLLLCSYLALYPSFFGLLAGPLLRGQFSAFGIAALWVALEYARAQLLTGFPWCLLGYSQARFIPLSQIADITGVYGVSFLIVAFNAAQVAFLPVKASRRKRAIVQEALPVIAILTLAFLYGQMRISQAGAEKHHRPSVKTVLLQGNIDQSIKWEKSHQRHTVEKYLDLAAKAKEHGPDILVFPETALPFFLQDSSEISNGFLAAMRSIGISAIVGSPAYLKSDGTIKYFNRAYVIEPDRGVSGHYDKIHLVPFGEYVPLKALLSFVNRLVPAAGDFEAGPGALPIKAGPVVAGIIICFEAIFPEVSRQHVQSGAEVLINLTNDAWFGKTSAPYQHMSMSRFRAIENRVPLLRAANTGISCIISDTGEITARSALFTEEIVAGVASYGRFPQTFYNRFGDLFAISSCLASLCLTLLWRGARGPLAK